MESESPELAADGGLSLARCIILELDWFWDGVAAEAEAETEAEGSSWRGDEYPMEMPMREVQEDDQADVFA
eukprot:CAMPEP_0172323100 /NCGR_PEP_ID=MMETSP1058-20130122/47856_1 /TAXON_ID=83371 /ORGANISM="Detonula confervacea, Strain CCMP 353" /LENGTH=70 /DNA_ID=CAMNT_0013039017 /DNA_START=54 /DNA_END=267 /DNA_ORIENTATION=-